MRRQVVAGLDIGTHSIKMVVAQRNEEGTLEVLGLAEEYSAGVRKGAVVNTEEVVKRILSLKNRVENTSSEKIDEVIVNIGGSHIFVTSSHGIVAVSRADGHISKEDIDRVLQAAQAFSLPSNKEILEVFPRQFIVDGEGNIKEAVGMKGVRLETDVLAICGFSPYVKNATDAVLGAGLGIGDMIPSPLMSSNAVATPQQKELGVAVVDIGAGITDLAVFEEGELIHVATFPIGSENITNDIAIGLRTEPDIAEQIKIEFGQLAFKGRKTEKVDVPDGPPLSFSQKFLSHIIESRIREIFQLITKDLRDISKQGMLPGGVILVGGTAKLPKIVDFAKKELKLPVKIGVPHGFISMQSDPTFLGAMGLIIGEGEVSEKTRKASGAKSKILQRIKKAFKVFIP
ncbi:cell division protein FtsA [Patescibacteria group bacterium]|nr:cell division protein FtsA [Patescibacteria group bacterium]